MDDSESTMLEEFNNKTTEFMFRCGEIKQTDENRPQITYVDSRAPYLAVFPALGNAQQHPETINNTLCLALEYLTRAAICAANADRIAGKLLTNPVFGARELQKKEDHMHSQEAEYYEYGIKALQAWAKDHDLWPQTATELPNSAITTISPSK